MSKPFLTAKWEKLATANYVIDPKVLVDYLPFGTELDIWNGRCYVSLVAFKFCNTKVKGIKIPFHVNFEEVNLRFYMKYKGLDNEWRRGVVFIKEFVPKPAIAIVARVLYNEPYQCIPMKHKFEKQNDELVVDYQWKNKNWNNFKIRSKASPTEMVSGSEEEFIFEHYWGYTKINENTTAEYAVEHPKWRVYQVNDFLLHVNYKTLYGSAFGFLDNLQPNSVFLAEGSDVIVKGGMRI